MGNKRKEGNHSERLCLDKRGGEANDVNDERLPLNVPVPLVRFLPIIFFVWMICGTLAGGRVLFKV